MKLFLIILLGYLIGSVPFALVIGKFFYHTDVREHGSKNLGGGNTGRVLGKKAGVSVMTLDILKVTLVVFLAKVLCGDELSMICGAMAAAIGHCYPIFAKFKGGKAVATMYGFLVGLFVVAGYSPPVFFLPLLVFLVVLYFSKIVALSSIISALAATAYIGLTVDSLIVLSALLFFSLLIIVRHRKNIDRMLQHKENKIKWM